VEKHRRKQLRDYKGQRYDVKEIPFDPHLMDRYFSSIAKSYLPEAERTYVMDGGWTINS